MPLLPDTTQLIEALVQRGVPDATINAIHKASTALDAALAVKTRIADLERQFREGELSSEAEEAADAEIDALTNTNVDEDADDSLAAYARALTAALPAIRSACRAS